MIELTPNEARILMNYLDRADEFDEELIRASIEHDYDEPDELKNLLERIVRECRVLYQQSLR